MGQGIRTDDMALATVLAIAGYPYTLVRLTERKAAWDFTCTDGQQDDFDDLIDDYREFEARVEPLQFILRYTELRQELFNFIPRSRRPASPAPQA